MRAVAFAGARPGEPAGNRGLRSGLVTRGGAGEETSLLTSTFLLSLAAAGAIVGAAIGYAILVFRREARRHRHVRGYPRRRRLIS